MATTARDTHERSWVRDAESAADSRDCRRRLTFLRPEWFGPGSCGGPHLTLGALEAGVSLLDDAAINPYGAAIARDGAPIRFTWAAIIGRACRPLYGTVITATPSGLAFRRAPNYFKKAGTPTTLCHDNPIVDARAV
jgi:hypothetical protein